MENPGQARLPWVLNGAFILFSFSYVTAFLTLTSSALCTLEIVH